jgi:ABC-2 type transport system permease protein
MNGTFPMLLRRELWEHRALWIAPLVWVGFIVLMFTWGTFQLRGMSDETRAEISRTMAIEEDRRQTVFGFSYLAIGALISGFTSIVVFFYLIDCLFAERRDRSILFWKSLPVSDTQVVLSKFVMAMVVVPLGVLLLSAATQLLLLGIWNLRFGDSVIGMLTPDWDIGSWMRAQLLEAGILFGGVMWYAPIAAYFLLLSVWVKRMAFLWAVLPLVAAPLLEALFVRSHHIAEFLGDRFGGHIMKMNIDSFFDGLERGGSMPRVQDLYDAFQLSGVFGSLETWVGMAAAAGLLFLTIRIRRFRDES